MMLTKMFKAKSILKKHQPKSLTQIYKKFQKRQLQQPLYTTNLLRRFASENPENSSAQKSSKSTSNSDFDVEDLFSPETQPYTYNDPQIFFLQRDFKKLKNHAKKGYLISALNFSFGAYLLMYMNPYLGGALTLLSTFPLIRSKMMMHNIKHVVTGIELDKKMKRALIIFGANYEQFTTEVKMLKTMKVKNMDAKENSTGFVVLVDAVDDLGVKREGLQVYIHQKHSDIPNMKLLTAVLKGDVEEVQKYEFVDEFDEVDN